MIKEFKEFIMKGNMLDMAIGIILGVAFGAVVSSLVADVITPPIGLILGHVDFSNLYVNLSGKEYASLGEAVGAGAPVIRYGQFLNTLINFLIVSLVLFFIVKAVNAMRKQPEAAPSESTCPFCLSSVPAKATRCPHCTSQLEPPA
ncbi:MAG: large conductance mechanosensitive channel protein MscL [Armatimonadetes bacterium]|nr:large conductance mechanosensitive channel protein MscL [Armatimonadota bacterium]